ncbi:MAG: hypothetical protein Q8927_11675 [Bacteroidota bacterium]|nr:hypothetical protein [Bacteroidota bacterium]
MKSFKLKEGRRSFTYPDKWEVEDSGTVISIYDSKNGVGALQLSVYDVPNPSSISLKDELEEFVKGRHLECSVSYREKFSYCSCLEAQTKSYWRYWMFFAGGTVVFGTYNCDIKNIDVEKEIVDEIISSAL